MTRRSDATAAGSPGQTLEDLLTGAWEDLATRRRTECPVCGGSMSPIEASTERFGRCGDCGTELA